MRSTITLPSELHVSPSNENEYNDVDVQAVNVEILVLDGFKAPVPDAEVAIHAITMPYHQTATTNPQGECFFVVPAATDYEIFASKDGQSDHKTVYIDSSTDTITLTLH